MSIKNLMIALKTAVDAGGGKTFSEFAVSDAPLRNVSLIAQAVIATQPIMPMPLGQNFQDLSPDGVLTSDSPSGGNYGVRVQNYNARKKTMQVVIPESMCLPDGGDCDITCDGFSVTRTEDEQVIEYSIDNPICSPGFQVTGEAFVKGEGVVTVSEKVRRGLRKELAFMDSAVSKYIYEQLKNLADTPDYDQISHFQVNGNVTAIHPDICKDNSLPIHMMEYFDAHQLENPVAIDTGVLYHNKMLAQLERTADDQSGTNANKWELFQIINAFKEFRKDRDKIIAFEPGSVGLAGYIKNPVWHKIPEHDDYYAGPIFSNQLPLTYDLYYKRECLGDEDGDPTLTRHTFKLKFYCQLFKRPNSCATKADVLVFEKGCFEPIDPCAPFNCDDVVLNIKAHETGTGTLTIPQNPLMVTDVNGQTPTINSGVISIVSATNNYAETVATYDFIDATNGEINVDLPAGNYKVKYEVSVSVGELTCTKLIETKVCVLSCDA